MRNVDTNNPEEAERGAVRAATGSIKELGEQNKHSLAKVKEKKKWQSAQAAVMLGDPGIKGTEGPSALSYGVDFERTGEELDRRRIHSRGCSDRLTNMTELTLMPCSSFALIVDSIC